MYHTLLASTLTVYVGGLVTFVPNAPHHGWLRLVFLNGNGAMPWHKHKAGVDDHEPYLVAATKDTCLGTTPGCSSDSLGHAILGGVGNQLARFRLRDAVAVDGTVKTSTTLDLSAAALAPVGLKFKANALCETRAADPDLAKEKPDPSWPIEAWIDIPGGIKSVKPDLPLQTLYLKGKECTSVPVAERVYIEIETVAGASPVFSWTNNGRTERAALAPGDTSIALWNLPRETHGPDGRHSAADHVMAYFSLLDDGKNCDCEVAMPLHASSQSSYTISQVRTPGGREYIASSEPAFCPPSEEHP